MLHDQTKCQTHNNSSWFRESLRTSSEPVHFYDYERQLKPPKSLSNFKSLSSVLGKNRICPNEFLSNP
ncbi:hypothetical protein QQG55_40765 [Brugia pahangi]|uniref:Ovule protein n=1 Tax=Brugia pahangi TaxID=6280 RepID=A0A0N4SXN6_BRUPA|nr:unnamed protein product [Brugia pahangi]